MRSRAGPETLDQTLRRDALLESDPVFQSLGCPALSGHRAHEIPAFGRLLQHRLHRAARCVGGAGDLELEAAKLGWGLLGPVRLSGESPASLRGPIGQ